MLLAGEAPEACQTHSKSGLNTHADEAAGPIHARVLEPVPVELCVHDQTTVNPTGEL
jgi:hypothetical protein